MRPPILTSLLVLGLTGALSTVSLQAEIHSFTDMAGHIVRGELTGINGDVVSIKREDGQTITVKASLFCPSDIAYLQQHGLSPDAATAKVRVPRLVTKDFRILPFCSTKASVKLVEKNAKNIDELNVNMADHVHIHGKKRSNSGTVNGETLYHVGKLVLMPPGERSGTLVAKLPTEEAVRRFHAVVELPDRYENQTLELAAGKTYQWRIDSEDGKWVFRVYEGSKYKSLLSAPVDQVQGIGFAATVRFAGGETDLSITFDSELVKVPNGDLSNLTLLSAVWRGRENPDSTADATQKVRQALAAGRKEIALLSTDLLNGKDPDRGKPKEWYILYEYNGVKHERIFGHDGMVLNFGRDLR